MSYSIVYKRQFIKVDGKILPLVLSGSNNVTEKYGRYERRARDWGIFPIHQGKVLYDEEEMLTYIQESFGGYQQHFKWYSKWVTDKGFISFMHNGIRNAKAIESLQADSKDPREVYLSGYLSVWHKNGEYYSDNTAVTCERAEYYKILHTTQEIKDWIAEAECRVEEYAKNDGQAFICIGFPDEEPVPRPKVSQKRKRKAAKRKEHEYYVARFGIGYIYRLTGRKLHTGINPQYAKQFKSQKQAEKWAQEKRIELRFGREVSYEYVA